MSVLGPNASVHRLPLLATFNWTLTLRLPASSFDHKEDLGKRCTHGCHRESSAFTWCSAGICGLTEGSCLWSDLLRSLQRSCCHWEWWGGSSTTKKPRVNTEGWTVTMTNLVIRCEVKSYIIYGQHSAPWLWTTAPGCRKTLVEFFLSCSSASAFIWWLNNKVTNRAVWLCCQLWSTTETSLHWYG